MAGYTYEALIQSLERIGDDSVLMTIDSDNLREIVEDVDSKLAIEYSRGYDDGMHRRWENVK